MVILMKSHHPRARTKPRMPPTTVKATPASLRNCAFRLTPSRRSSSSRTGAIAGNSEDEADREEERQGKQFSKRLKMRRVLSEVESNHSSQSRLLEQDEDSQAILGILERSTSYERHKRKHTDACGGDPNGSSMAWESAPAAAPPPGQLLARSSSLSIDRSLPGMPRPKKKGSFMSQQVCSRCAPPRDSNPTDHVVSTARAQMLASNPANVGGGHCLRTISSAKFVFATQADDSKSCTASNSAWQRHVQSLGAPAAATTAASASAFGLLRTNSLR